MLQRLQKILAQAGIASRRKAEALITSGQVEVNGRIVTELGSKADPQRDRIRVAGRTVRLPSQKIYLALHKPARVLTALSDPKRRPHLGDLLHGVRQRVFPVGRLGYHASGLLLLTNDGEWAARVLQGLRQGLEQVYQFKVKRPLTPEEQARIEERCGPIRLVRPGENPWYEVVLQRARRDAIRDWFWRLGHPVEKVRRVRIGPVTLGRLEPGQWRTLTPREVQEVLAAAQRTKGSLGRSRKKSTARETMSKA